MKQAPAACARAGFTLIELLVVLVILALLAGLVGPQLFGKVDSSKVKTAEAQIKMLHGALQTFRLDVGRYPTTVEGLDALIRPPPDAGRSWSGPYLDGAVPTDPWRTPYRYMSPADNLQGFALYSLGADSKDGGEGIDGEVGYLPAEPK
ncbi:MAG: type II secretion system major pseudopilin GspG [Chloroflexi bacterium]|nr:type II secretion system major pseudopilin GspG [Chloroflexota bacterium]